MSKWYPTKWWRVLAPDGELWCETSDENEARSNVRPGDVLERLFQTEPLYLWEEQNGW